MRGSHCSHCSSIQNEKVEGIVNMRSTPLDKAFLHCHVISLGTTITCVTPGRLSFASSICSICGVVVPPILSRRSARLLRRSISSQRPIHLGALCRPRPIAGHRCRTPTATTTPCMSQTRPKAPGATPLEK